MPELIDIKRWADAELSRAVAARDAAAAHVAELTAVRDWLAGDGPLIDDPEPAPAAPAATEATT